MTDERAMEILDPDHLEYYESIEPIIEACRIGMEAIRKVKELRDENAALRERLDITKMALEYACLETLQSNEQYLEELKEKVNKYIKQSEDVVYGQKNGATFRFAEVRLAELKGGAK